jgi:putative SOS response-associated peptidase YedK
LPHHELFAIAGLWSQWEDTSNGEIIFSYTMVTTEANELMAKIHNTKKRMPLILTPENEKAWLEGADYHFFTHPKVDLMATPIFPEGYINSVLTLEF